MTDERKELIKRLEEIRKDYIEETCPVMKGMLKDVKKKYKGKTIKFLKSPGLYFMIDKVSLHFEDSVLFEGTKVMGPNFEKNEKFVLPLTELKDEYFQVIEDSEMEQEFVNLINLIRENVARSKAEKEAREIEEKMNLENVSQTVE